MITQYAPALATRIDRHAQPWAYGPEALAYDLLLERNGTALLYYPTSNFADGNLDVVLKMMLHERSARSVSATAART